jgi:hypothetical protein
VLFGVPRPMSGKTDFDFDRSGCQLMTRQLHKQDRSACQRRMNLAGRWWLKRARLRTYRSGEGQSALLINPNSLKRKKTRPRSRRYSRVGCLMGPRIWLRFVADITKTRSFKLRAWWTTTQSHRVYANPSFHFGTEVP